MIEPWHAPILVMASIIVLEFLLGINRTLARRLYRWLFQVRRAVVWGLVLMLITVAVVALFGSNTASTLVGILGGLAAVFAFLVLIRNEDAPGAPEPQPDADPRRLDHPEAR